MTTTERPQLYLFTPPEIELGSFPETLARVLDTHPVACVRLDLATRDEERLARAADALREVCHARDIALVIRDHMMLADRLGLDGVHLSDASRSVRAARKLLGEDAIVGCSCGTSRHDGMTAGEAGADYVSFGPVTASALGDGSHAPLDLFEWWSEVIEVPVVAEGGLDEARVAELAPLADFLAFGEEIWSAEDPAARLGEMIAAMG
jgi:thiamine-phosphate pyrophosphorylase